MIWYGKSIRIIKFQKRWHIQRKPNGKTEHGMFLRKEMIGLCGKVKMAFCTGYCKGKDNNSWRRCVWIGDCQCRSKKMYFAPDKREKGVLCYQYDLIENRKEKIVDEDVRGVSRIT